MAIDHNIITRGMSRVEMEPQSNALARMLRVQGAQQEQEMNAFALDEKRRSVEDQNQLRSALSAPGADPYNVLLKRGRVKEATEFAKANADIKKTGVETRDKEQDIKVKQYQYLANVLKDVKDQPGYQTALQLAEAFGMSLEGIPPIYDPRVVETARGAFTTEVQKWTDQRAREQQAETQRHNRATEATSAGQLAETKRHHGVTEGQGKVPPGYRAKPDGTLEAIPGGPADLKTNAAGVAKVSDAKDVLTLLDEVDAILPKATGSYTGAGYDAFHAGVFGNATGGAKATSQLKALQGALVAKMPKMSGPQSDKDVQLYREMAGQVGDPTIPVEQRQAASAMIRKLNEKYAGMPEGSSKKNREASGKVTTPAGGVIDFGDLK